MALLEWAFILGLAFKEQTPEDADFIRMIYTIRLKKVCPVVLSDMNV